MQIIGTPIHHIDEYQVIPKKEFIDSLVNKLTKGLITGISKPDVKLYCELPNSNNTAKICYKY